MKPIRIFLSQLLVCILMSSAARSADLNFGTTIYFTAPDSSAVPGTVLTNSGTTLSGFSFDGAPTTHPIFRSGVYYPVTDCQSHNLWVRFRHVATDASGPGFGLNITATTGSALYGGPNMIGGFSGFLYQIEIFKDQNFTGTRSNILGVLHPTTVTVASLETLAYPGGPHEWLCFQIQNTGSSGWNLNSTNFTGSNPNSHPGFSPRPVEVTPGNQATYVPKFSENFPTGRDSIYAITLPIGGYSEFKMTANGVSRFQYGYEFSTFGYQGMSMAFGEGPALSDSLVHEKCYRAGGSIFLKPSGLGPYTYSWSNGASTQNLEDVAPGTYTVTVTDDAGCLTQVTKTINPGPVFTVDLSQTFLSATQEVVVSSAITGGAGNLQYLWNTGSTNDSLTTDSNGVYILAVTDGQNCVAKDTITVSQFVAIKDNRSAGSFSMYPNPTDGSVWIKTGLWTEPAEIWVANTQGQLVWMEKIPAGIQSSKIDLKPYSKGIYTVFIKTREGTTQQRLVVF